MSNLHIVFYKKKHKVFTLRRIVLQKKGNFHDMGNKNVKSAKIRGYSKALIKKIYVRVAWYD